MATKLVLTSVVLVVLGGVLYPVWIYVNRDREAPAAAPEEDVAPGLGEVETVNPFDSIRVDEGTGTWVLYLLEGEKLVQRIEECQAFVADGGFLKHYPDARGKPLGLRVEVGRPLSREMRRRVDEALSKGPLSWFDPP